MPLLLLLALLPAAPISLYADIRPGAAPISSAPDLPIRVGNRIFFTATTEDAGVELWATDGTTAGTQQLTSIGSATGLNYRFAGETKLFFTIDDGDHGEELWISDGTPAGTHLVKDIVPGSGGPNIFSGVVKHDVFYFYATTPEEGGEPWRSDGTEAGTFLIDDINSDTVGADSTPQWFFASSTHVYFVTASAGIKNDVYVVDINNPTTATRVNDGLISAPTTFVSFNGQVYFDMRSTQSNGDEVWRHDGTELHRVTTFNYINANISALTVSGAHLYFQADDGLGSGDEIWRVSTAGAVERVTNFDPAVQNPVIYDVGGSPLFQARDVSAISQIYAPATPPGQTVLTTFTSGSSITSGAAIAVNGVLFFSATTATQGKELWTATSAGASVNDVIVGSVGSNPEELTVVGSRLFFSADNAEGGRELYMRAGVANDTPVLFDVGPGFVGRLIALGNTLLFRADDGTSGLELWSKDTTLSNQPTLVKNIAADVASGARELRGFSTFAVATVDTPASGKELMSIDSASGTNLNFDVWPGATSSLATNLEVIQLADGRILTSGDDGEHGNELVVLYTNGTIGVVDIRPGLDASDPQQFVLLGSKVYFMATSDMSPEMHVFDETTVTRVMPGYALGRIAATNSRVFFALSTNDEGYEIWSTEGLNAPVSHEVNAGTANSTDYVALKAVGDRVYFDAVRDAPNPVPETGRELWVTDGTAPPTLVEAFVGPTTSITALSTLVDVDGVLFFTSADDVTTLQLHRHEAGALTATTITNFAAGSFIEMLSVAGDRLFFKATQPAFGAELFVVTKAGVLTKLTSFTVENGTLNRFLPTPNGLYFAADEGTNGTELWFSDGSVAGTRLVRDVFPGARGSNPTPLLYLADVQRLLFSASNGVHGSELWISDGTAAGTRMVEDVAAGQTNFNPKSLVRTADGRILMIGYTQTVGTEIFILGAPVDLSVSSLVVTQALPLGVASPVSVTVTNMGAFSAKNAFVEITLPSGVVLADTTVCSATGNVVRCDVGDVAVGASVTTTFQARGELLATGLTLTAVAVSEGLDVAAANDATSAATSIVAAADLAVAQAMSAAVLPAGETHVLTVQVTNNGPSTATNVQLSGGIDTDFAISTVAQSQGLCTPGSGGTVTCSFGSIAAAATATLTLEVFMPNPGIFSSTMTVSAAEADAVSANNSSTLTADIVVKTDPSLGVVPNPKTEKTGCACSSETTETPWLFMIAACLWLARRRSRST